MVWPRCLKIGWPWSPARYPRHPQQPSATPTHLTLPKTEQSTWHMPENRMAEGHQNKLNQNIKYACKQATSLCGFLAIGNSILKPNWPCLTSQTTTHAHVRAHTHTWCARLEFWTTPSPNDCENACSGNLFSAFQLQSWCMCLYPVRSGRWHEVKEQKRREENLGNGWREWRKQWN